MQAPSPKSLEMAREYHNREMADLHELAAMFDACRIEGAQAAIEAAAKCCLDNAGHLKPGHPEKLMAAVRKTTAHGLADGFNECHRDDAAAIRTLSADGIARGTEGK